MTGTRSAHKWWHNDHCQGHGLLSCYWCSQNGKFSCFETRIILLSLFLSYSHTRMHAAHTHTHTHTLVLTWTCACTHVHTSRQSSLSYFPLFSWPAHPHCTQLDPRSCLTFQRGILHQWKLGLLSHYLCLQILQHFVAVSIVCCGKAQIFDCMNVSVFISPVSSLLKPVIHFRDSVL